MRAFSRYAENQPTDNECSDGTCVRDYLHVIDLARGHLLALQALGPVAAPPSHPLTNGNSHAHAHAEEGVFAGCKDGHFKAYNLGKGHGMSVLQIVEAMRKATGHDYKYEVIGRRCVFLSTWCCDFVF